MVYHVGDSIRTQGGEGPLTPGGGARLLNRNQKATARQLSLAAYLLSSDGHGKDETSILENLPHYADVYDTSARPSCLSRRNSGRRSTVRHQPCSKPTGTAHDRSGPNPQRRSAQGRRVPGRTPARARRTGHGQNRCTRGEDCPPGGRPGVRPERILALTFSRRAADEMSEPVRTRVPYAALVETRTFHSFAVSVVRRHPP